jgi:hypothetical protein
MKIQVLENYGGAATREYRVLPGVYEFDDPALMGAAQLLLDLGKAVEVKSSVPTGLAAEALMQLVYDPTNPDPDQLPVNVDPAVIEESEVLSAAIDLVTDADGSEDDDVIVNTDDDEPKATKRKTSRKD